MTPISIPAAAALTRPGCTPIQMGPPPGVSDEDCGTVEMLVSPVPLSSGVGRPHFAYFRPSPIELRQLLDGGFLELALYGNGVQPFGLAVWPDPTEQ